MSARKINTNDLCRHGHRDAWRARVKFDPKRECYRWMWYCMKCDRVAHIARWARRDRAA